jgi:hypothetical protein
MSNLLEQASLVLIPSGYKEDVVYSEIPIDGAGDMSFTRASNGTRINSAGLVEVCPWNLAGYSEQFDNAYWVKQSATVTANSTTAPNGTLTADTFNVTATAYSSIYNAGALSLSLGIYTQGIYAKKGTKNYLYILDLTATSGKAWFNLDTGVVGTVASGYTATMESVGNGWYRCSLSQNTSVTPSYFHFGASDSDNSFTPSSSGNIYIWGAQLNIGATAKPYFPTTDRLDVPRLTYQNGGGGCPSLLLEKQSTNLVSYSQDFTNYYWSKLNQGIGDVAVVTANYAISPDGTQNATRFVCNLNGGTTSSVRSWMIASFTAPATSTLSIWIKLNSAGTKTFVFSDSGGGTKTISGTDWQRIDGTFVGAGGEFRIGLIGGSTSDTMDCCIWGAQAEASSYPTSYIPTTSSSATRGADLCNKTGISSLIGQSQGVLFVDLVITGTTGNNRFSISDGSNTNWIFIGTPEDMSNGVSRFYIKTNGSVAVDVGTSSYFTFGQRYKLALAYKSGDWAVYGNGVQLYSGTDSIASVSSPLSVFNFFNATGGNADCGEQVNQAVIFPTRLTNAELASLTTI